MLVHPFARQGFRTAKTASQILNRVHAPHARRRQHAAAPYSRSWIYFTRHHFPVDKKYNLYHNVTMKKIFFYLYISEVVHGDSQSHL